MFRSLLPLAFFLSNFRLTVSDFHYPGGFGNFEHGSLGHLGHIEKFGPDFGGFGLSHGFGGPKYFGGSEIEQESYGGGGRSINDEHFHKVSGADDANLKHDQRGFVKGEEVFKDVKGDSGYFNDINGVKNDQFDGGDYHGSKHFGQEGKSGGEKNEKQGHKKGHTVKGFSTSHHKDEHGKTEEYFDEEHDEGGNVVFDGQSGKSGESGHSAFKGGREDGKFAEGDSKKGTHYEHEVIDGKARSNQGHFDENKHAGHGAILGDHEVHGVGDISGHEESSNLFKHHPSFYY